MYNSSNSSSGSSKVKRAVLYYAVLYYAVLCCAVLCCAVLCCAVLCCAVLCCAVLCCAMLCMTSMPKLTLKASSRLCHGGVFWARWGDCWVGWQGGKEEKGLGRGQRGVRGGGTKVEAAGAMPRCYTKPQQHSKVSVKL